MVAGKAVVAACVFLFASSASPQSLEAQAKREGCTGPPAKAGPQLYRCTSSTGVAIFFSVDAATARGIAEASAARDTASADKSQPQTTAAITEPGMWDRMLLDFCKVGALCHEAAPNWLGWAAIGLASIVALVLVLRLLAAPFR